MPETKSVFNNKSRYIHGGTTEVSDRLLEWWDRKKFTSDLTDVDYVLEKIYEYRPDKLAGVLYGDTRLWWVICQYNNIIDPHGEFIEGKVLKIPSKERVNQDFLNGTPGGVDSTRQYKPNITELS